MKGAILGDIIGSRFEFTKEPIEKDEFELFTSDCYFTDDTVLTVATMDALLSNKDFKTSYYEWANKYRGCVYDDKFREWMKSTQSKSYNSYGTGAAKRVSPIGIVANELMEAIYLGYESAIVTHNHIDGLKGASASALAVFLAKEEYDKKEMITLIEGMFGYNLQRKLKYIKPYYSFSSNCKDTVPESIVCFLEASSWEETIRNAVWLNGDTDTMATIAGSIAEVYYGIPQDYEYMIYRYLPTDMIEVINKFYGLFKPKKSPLLF